MPESKPNATCFWIAIVVLALGMAGAWRIASSNPGIDFFHMWGVGHAKSPKVSFTHVYDKQYHPRLVKSLQAYQEHRPSERLELWLAENRRLYDTGFHPTGTPFFYTVHAIANGGSPPSMDPDRSFWIFQIFSVLVFVTGCSLLGTAFGLRWSQALLLTGLLLILHRGLQSDIGVANVNRIQCGIFGFAIWLLTTLTAGKRPAWLAFFWFGLILGLLTMYKPNVAMAVALPGLALFIDRRFAETLGYAGGSLLGAVTGFLLVLQFRQLKTWLAWRTYVASIANEPFELGAGNYALSRMFSDAWVRNVSIALTFLLTALVVWWIWKSRTGNAKRQEQVNVKRYALIATIGLMLPLISAPVAWGHYMVLAIPLGIMLIAHFGTQPIETNPSRWLLVTVMGLVLCGLVPVSLIGGVPPQVVLLSIQFGLGMLLVAGLFSLRSS